MGTTAEIRHPHTTPSTIVYETTIYPPLFHYECNVGECYAASGKRHEIGDAEKAARKHQRDFHSDSP